MPRPGRTPLCAWVLCALALLAGAVPAAAAGAWTVAREDGVAWLHTPGGKRFYSKGVNIVAGFKPDDATRNGTLLSTGAGFYWANHYASAQAWRQDVDQKLAGWGFNTRGAWSDPAKDFSLALAPDLELGRLAQLHWFDPYAPDASERAAAKARELLAPYAGDDRLLGVFTDNEAGWWNSQLFRWYLARPLDNGAKQRLLDLLRTWYGGSWKRLLADFVPDKAHSFADLEHAGASLRLRPGGRGMAVVNLFTRRMAATYYRLVHDAVKAVRPGVLVLGDRLPLYFNQDAVLGMRDWVDVISTNYNVDAPDGWVAPWYFEALDALGKGRPVLVSEWFCAGAQNRSGNTNNGHLLTVPDQAARVKTAEAALRNFAALPGVVGTHWFQLYDEPLGGRADGEDYDFGIIDRHNAPYAELGAMFAALNPDLEDIHAEARPADSAPSTTIHRARDQRLGDAAITDWDKARTRLRGWAVEKPYAPFGDVHLAWSPSGIYLLHLAQNHLEPSFLAYKGEFPLSEAYRMDLALDAGRGRHEFSIALTPTNSTRWANVWELTPRVFALHPGQLPAATTSILVQQLAAPLPHIALAAFIPAAALGVPALQAGQAVKLGLDVRGFFREKRMTVPGPARDPYGPDGPIPDTQLRLED